MSKQKLFTFFVHHAWRMGAGRVSGTLNCSKCQSEDRCLTLFDSLRSPIALSFLSRSDYRIIKRVSFPLALLLAVAVFLIYVNRSSAAGGDIDTTFNTGGAGADAHVYAVAIQPNGKIVISGFFTSYSGDAAASDFVMRLNADGTCDTTFNTGGAGADNAVQAVAIQPDGLASD